VKEQAMQGVERKAAVAAYKEQKVSAGIYALRCIPSGACWVGQAPNLDKIQNRIWFSLRHDGHPRKDLQAAWREHGPDAFTFEIVEKIEDEKAVYLRERILKERLAHWAAALKAQAI